MSVALEVNSAPVDNDDQVSLSSAGEEFVIPAACMGCQVLEAKKIAESMGMVVVRRTEGEKFFPENKITEVRDELVRRSDEAISGACKFILQQECWRVERVKE